MTQEINKKLFLENISLLIKERELKVKDVEAEVGVSIGYISRISKDDKTKLSIDFCMNIANYFEMNLLDLLTTPYNKLTATEVYLSQFIEKLRRKTNREQLSWEEIPLSEEIYVNVPGWGYDQVDKNFSGHPLEPIFQQSEDEFWFYISNSFGINIKYLNSFYELKLNQKANLYIMKVEEMKGEGKESELTGKTAIECYIFINKKLQLLFSDYKYTALRKYITNLYDAIEKYARLDKLSTEVKTVLDSFMENNS